MQLKTIVNHVERHKVFVYQHARWSDPVAKTEIEIPIEPRANSRLETEPWASSLANGPTTGFSSEAGRTIRPGAEKVLCDFAASQ